MAKTSKNQSKFSRLSSRISRSKRATSLLVAAVVMTFGGVGTYVISRSSAAVSPASICGSGYSVVKSNTQDTKVKYYILKNTSTKKFCVLTVSAGKAYGVSKQMSAKGYLKNKVTGEQYRFAEEVGSFKYYAGPKYVSYGGVSGKNWEMRSQGGMRYDNFTHQATLVVNF